MWRMPSANFADSYEEDGDLVEGNWRFISPLLHSLQKKSGRTTDGAKMMRDSLRDYVNSTAGSVEWQRRAIFFGIGDKIL